MKTFVIAGTKDQADQWIKKHLEKRAMSGVTTLSWSDYVKVTRPEQFKGYSDPHGVFIGTWRELPNILEIVETLYTQCSKTNPAIEKVLIELRKTKKKHNKLTPVAGGWINESLALDHSANLLAKEIDEQVLASVTNKINGGAIPTVIDQALKTLIAAAEEMDYK